MTSAVPPPAKPATIYDVARRAGVSHQTVALFLRGHEGFRPETRERVEQAVSELNYRPNLAARSLARSRSHRIAALVYELAEIGPSKTIQGATDRAREAGYLLDVLSLDPSNEDAVEEAMAALGQQDLAGIIAFAPVDRLAESIARAHFSVPFVAETEVELGVQPETSINKVGLRLIVDHLVGLGHRTFFSVSGPDDWIASRNREHAFAAALAAHGLRPVGSLAGDWSAASGYRAGLALPLDRGVTALVVGNDQMALGVLRALRERGITAPGDMSVTGFDDIPEAEFFQPPLTTVRIEYASQGQQLIDRLLDQIEPESQRPPLVETAPVLRVRQSTAAPPSA